MLSTRLIYYRTDEAIRGHVFCSFLALLLRAGLQDRLAARGFNASSGPVYSQISIASRSSKSSRTANLSDYAPKPNYGLHRQSLPGGPRGPAPTIQHSPPDAAPAGLATGVGMGAVLRADGQGGHGDRDELVGVEEGSLIGPYRVVGRLGRFGTGHVVLAERADGQFEQKKVALKGDL